MAYPGTIYAIGRNYVAHAAELGNAVPAEPVVFLKSISALRTLAPSPMGFADESFHHEVELVVRVGRAVGLRHTASWGDVDGVALGLDLTRREVQAAAKAAGLPWTSSKSFAGSAVLGPFVDMDRAGEGPFRFSLRVNGEPRQQGTTEHMVFDVPTLLTHLARAAPLLVGDLVYTGTPAGVGPIRVGDTFELSLSNAEGDDWAWSGEL